MLNRYLKLAVVFVLPLLVGAGCSLVPGKKVVDGGVWYSDNKAETFTQRVFVGHGKDEEDPADDELIDNLNILFLEFHPLDSRVLYANTNKGVYFSENSANSWQVIFKDVSVQDLAPDPNKRGTLYVTVGNTVMKTEDNGGSWRQIYIDSRPETIISQVSIDPLDAARIYIGTSSGDLIASRDAGETWRVVDGFAAATETDRKRGAPIVELIVNPRDTDQLYVATLSRGIWASFDKGVSWQNLLENYNHFPGAAEFKSLMLDETADGAMLYVSSYGLLWTFDGGLSWQPLDLLTPPESINIRAIAINPFNPDEIYYANETVLYRTLDGGVNWITQKLPTTRAASSIQVDFFDSNKVYLGVEKVAKKKKGLIRF